MTTTYDYRILHNVSSGYMRGFQADDLLIRGHESTIVVEGDPVPRHVENPEYIARMTVVCSAVFRRHNHDDRPDGKLAPSLSVGDVIRVKETGVTWEDGGWFSDFSVEPVGFAHVHATSEAHNIIPHVPPDLWGQVWAHERLRQDKKSSP